MASAADLLVPLRPGLVPVPAAGQPGVCPHLPQRLRFLVQPVLSVPGGGEGRRSGSDPADLHVGRRGSPPSGLEPADCGHRHLRGYKDVTLRLAALVAVFLQNHGRCLGDFESVVCVPSTARVAVEAIVQRLPALRDHYRPALKFSGLGSKSELRADRFVLTRRVDSEKTLLLDDTFTRGPTMFSAVAALREAGAVVVGPVVLGRHIQPDWGPSAELLSWLRARTWDEARCCRCGGERANPGQLL